MRYSASILLMIALAAVLCAPVIIEAQNSLMQPDTLVEVQGTLMQASNDKPMIVGAAEDRRLQLPK